jgi:hypothetical protein
MTTLLLRRTSPLSVRELSQLPRGCVGVQGESDIIARATIKLPLPRLLSFAVAMGRAIPDARFESFEEAEGELPPPGPEAELPPAELELAEEPDPWALIAAGDYNGAEAVLGRRAALDPDGRDRVRALLGSTDPAEVALACRLARLTRWKSLAQNMRSLVQHADVRVRRDAVTAMGVLTGPAFVPVVRPLLQDPSPEVREAAAAALAQLGGK